MEEPRKLHILWTCADVITFEHMVNLYATNCIRVRDGYPNGWWDAVTVIIWGASAKLVAENEQVQAIIKASTELGVHFSACKPCTDKLPGVTEKLAELGIELRTWGGGLTDILKSNDRIITI